ncbi:unnamed protein product [Peniophora sp. CBMAI 1063]|nr:unnamed protein product [Peniophora sp. CBMAI 1063]
MESKSRHRPFAKSRPEDEAGDGLWDTYLDAVESEDKASIESWNGSTTGILTFTGLFAATTAAFIIESYKTLQPDTGAQTIALLSQLVSATNNTPVVPTNELPSEPFQTPQTAVIVNALWFLSLVISLVCALLATLIQEWTRDFRRDIQWRSSGTTIKEYAFKHIYVRMGVERYRLDDVATLIVALIHVAVALFLIGLSIFLFPIDHTSALVVTIAASVAAFLYVMLSVIPFWDHSCPYRTPMTYFFVVVEWAIVTVCVAVALPVWLVTSSIAEHDWSCLSDISKFKLAEVTTGLRSIFYFLIPRRSLPGQGDLPSYIPDYFSPENVYAHRSFVDYARLIFIWQHTSEYMLSDEGRDVLLHYLPCQLLDSDFHDFGFFFVYLRHRGRFMLPIASMMTSVETIPDALGAIRLLQMLIISEDEQLEESALGVWDGRWEAMHSVFRAVPDLLLIVDSLNMAAREYDNLSLLLALADLRWTVIIVRAKLLRQRLDEEVSTLDTMLLDMERVRGLGLLPLHTHDHGRLERSEFDQHHQDVSFCYELAARNALTTIAHIFYPANPETDTRYWTRRESPYPKKDIPNMLRWHEFFTATEIDACARETHGHSPSPVFLSLLQRANDPGLEEKTTSMFLANSQDVVDALDHLKRLMLLTSHQPPSDLVSQGDAHLRDLGIVPVPRRPPSSTSSIAPMESASAGNAGARENALDSRDGPDQPRVEGE